VLLLDLPEASPVNCLICFWIWLALLGSILSGNVSLALMLAAGTMTGSTAFEAEITAVELNASNRRLTWRPS
jgi:hypothetical protein